MNSGTKKRLIHNQMPCLSAKLYGAWKSKNRQQYCR